VLEKIEKIFKCEGLLPIFISFHERTTHKEQSKPVKATTAKEFQFLEKLFLGKKESSFAYSELIDFGSINAESAQSALNMLVNAFIYESNAVPLWRIMVEIKDCLDKIKLVADAGGLKLTADQYSKIQTYNEGGLS
jgi:hypothetical protein